jgi:hypothetical protein
MNLELNSLKSETKGILFQYLLDSIIRSNGGRKTGFKPLFDSSVRN